MEFNFEDKYILENAFVRLQPLELSDFDYLLEYSENEPELWKFNANGANGRENLIKYIVTAIQNRTNETEYPFIVFDKSAQKYVGCTRFYDIKLQIKTLELGYTWYRKSSQNTGINKNCKLLLLEFAFEKMKMERVGFSANSKNERSIAAMKSIGCVYEGLIRSYNIGANGDRIDGVKLSILRDEWTTTVKNHITSQIANLNRL